MQPCSWSPDNSKPLCRCLGANSCPLEEQLVHVTTKPSLQCLHWFRRGRFEILHRVSEKCCQQKGSQSSSRDQATGRDAEKKERSLGLLAVEQGCCEGGPGGREPGLHRALCPPRVVPRFFLVCMAHLGYQALCPPSLGYRDLWDSVSIL